MNIEEIKEQKKILEDKVLNMILLFENDTGVSVSNIDIDTTETTNMGGDKNIFHNKVDIDVYI